MNKQPTTRQDTLIMVCLALLALAASITVAWFVTERIPHLEDEIAYLFQARTYARAALVAPVPSSESAFFVPFTLVIGDAWVGKYAIGWPLLLAIGEALGAGWLVTPVLGSLTTLLVYCLGRDLYNRQVGVLAGLLTLTSPFFLIQTSTYMSHAAAGFWATLLAWAWFRSEMHQENGCSGRGYAALGGLALGMLALTRHLTAVGVVLPYLLAVGMQVIRKPRRIASLLKTYWPMALIAVMLALLQPGYLALVTGSPATNLYTMVWDYDRLGFGPGIGPNDGHTLAQALKTAGQDLTLWASVLFGWPYASWVPVLLGLVAGLWRTDAAHKRRSLLLIGPFAGLVIVHLVYWIGAQVYGPRYYYEGIAGVAVLAAAGIQQAAAWVTRKARPQSQQPGRISAYVLAGALIAFNVGVYIPSRVDNVRGLYGITREPLEELEALKDGDPVLVFVRGRRWIEYAALFSLNSPWLDGPVVVAHDNSESLANTVTSLYPGYDVWFYDRGEWSQEPSPYPESD